ncbi:MAG: sigma-54-dependent Fis family transcriptional regulator [candidate division Zixibacteria bacterium]|nr:sigma-54-dependent Fis family transcriptional regulator [candidate division Zixibacteria bacterium]
MKYSVLIVDDDKIVNEVATETLQRAGYDCRSAFSGEEALAILDDSPVDIVLSDLKMDGMDGIELLRQTKKFNPQTVVVVMTAFGTIETAVKAIRLGAYDFLVKPVLPATLEHVLSRVTEILELRSQNEIMRRDLADRFQNIVGKSKEIKEIFDLIQTVADARSTILITGASGTGKELVARAIHYTSGRRSGPFIKLNCAALPENLVEAELFGYEKGAFTDAKKTNHGRFELADGGTLLLDEISEMPLNLQAKLLRVIQEREFERIGSSSTIKVDIRLIATSNRNLKEYVSAGKLREDLFFRLNVIPIHLCPLNERKEDIPLLARHFIATFNTDNGKSVRGLDNEALRLLTKYHWPGNVRELENLVERAVVTTKGEILTEDDFPADLVLGPIADDLPSLKVPMKLEEGSRYLILKTLEKFNGNKTRAADALGITTRTIRNKLAEYRLQDSR